MGCDMVLAIGSAAVDGLTLFGVNYHAPNADSPVLERIHARPHEPGESVQTTYIEIPQARQTYDVLGCRSRQGWGLQHGLNEHQLAIGCASWKSRLSADEPGLTGPDLVRLALERCRTAQ